jgi:hypothetical protein
MATVIIRKDTRRIGHMMPLPAWNSSIMFMGLPSGFVRRSASGNWTEIIGRVWF